MTAAPQTSAPAFHDVLAEYAAPTYTVHGVTAGGLARTERGSGLAPEDAVVAAVTLTRQPTARVAAYLLAHRGADKRTVRIPANPSIDGTAACDLTIEAHDVGMVRDDVAKIIEGHEGVGYAHTTPRGHDGAADIDVFDHDGQPIAFVCVYADGRVEVLPIVRAEIVSDVEVVEVAPTALELADASRAAATRANVTVYYRGRPMTARRVEPLQNGFWRADLPGGTVALYEADPTDDPSAVLHSG